MAQDRLWLNGSQLLDFNPPDNGAPITGVTMCNLPLGHDYNGAPAQYAQNAQYDEHGKLLFFVVDGNIYDREGYRMADNDEVPNFGCTTCIMKGIQQVGITLMPGTCDRYYIIMAGTVESGGSAQTQLAYSILDLSLPSEFHPGRFGRLWGKVEFLYNPGLSGMPVTWAGLTPLQSDAHRMVLVQNANQSPTPGSSSNTMGNVLQVIYDSPVAAKKMLYYKTALDVMAAPITATGIGTPTVLAHHGGQGPGNKLFMAGQMAVTAGQNGNPVLAATRNSSSSTGSANSDYTLDLYYLGPNGTTVTSTVAVNTNAAHVTGVNYRTRGLAFSPNGRYLYFAQPFLPNLGYVDLQDPALAIHDVGAQLGINIAPYGSGQINCNAVPAGGSGVYLPSSTGLAVMQNANAPVSATWQSPAISTAPINAPPASAFALLPAFGGFTQYLMDPQNYNDQQIPSLLQQACCEANERIPEANHTNTFAGTTTQATPWTPQNNPLASAPLCAQPGGQAGHVFFAQDFTVQTGAKLYVRDMEWRFGPNARLIVQKGAFAQFDNCILRGDACTPGKWPGVELYGTPTAIQGHSAYPADQGRLVLKNSTVQDAVVGVTVGKKDIFGMVVGTGGILEASGSTFRNCRIGVNFYAYQNKLSNGSPTGNRSNFARTAFTADTAYISPLDFSLHAQLWKVDGIRFMGCTFENLRTTEHNSSQLGRGIHSLDAGFSVTSLCADPGPVPGGMCQNVIPTRFTGLDMGIRAANAVTARNFTVDGAEFNDNVCGVFANSVLNFEVHKSNFRVGSSKATSYTGQDDEQYWQGAHRGIYSYKSWGFLVDDNTLTNNTNATTSRLGGIVTGYSGGHNDIVFRNHAIDLERAYVGEGICADLSNRAITGLWYLCNTNVNNKNGIVSGKDISPGHASDGDQTIRTNQGSRQRVADNSFGQTSGQLDIKNENFGNNALSYWWTYPEVPYEPQYTSSGVSSDNYDANHNYLVRDPANCASRVLPIHPVPPNPGPAELRSYWMDEAQERKAAYGNTRYLYDQLIDGGSTDETVQEIQSTWPNEAWDLRATLLGRSPFLSTEVLFEVVKKNIMPPAMVAEICIANPDATKKEGFLKWLQYESPCTMPQYMIDNIIASWETKTYRTTLEDNLGFNHSEMTQALCLVIASYHADTLVEQVDSIRATWQVLRTPAARYAEILTYLQQDNFDSAYAVVDRLPVEFKLKDKEISEKDRTKQYIGIVQGYRTNGRSEAELQDYELTALRNLRDGGYDLPGEWAQNILCFGYGECRPPRTGGDGEGAPKALRMPMAEDGRAEPALNVYPNPANSWANLVYNLKTAPDKAYIAIRDITGKEMARIPVDTLEGQAIWDTRNVAPGTYTVDLVNRGVSVGATKLVVKQ